MNLPERIIIFIFPENIDWKDFDYNPNEYGAEVSTEDDILVNKVDEGYSIVYMDTVFEELDVKVFGQSVINLIQTNLPGKVIEVEIRYFPMEHFSEDCGRVILNADDFFQECDEDLISYITSPSVSQLIECWDEDEQEFVFDGESSDDEDPTNPWFGIDEDDDMYPDGEYGPDEDHFYHYDSVPKKTKYKVKKKKTYSSSRLIRSDKVRKSIKKHNVIVSSDKSAIKRDTEVIASFLKDFIPGKQNREFRKEILDRWVHTLVISKKSARKLQKAHENKYDKKGRRRKKATQNSVLEIASRVFGGYDLFSDPNR